ncbi:FAD binding domain-containing protein [Ensifer soli]|uniref:FAD binding domain-containing protein n=1 Tax=Ciceribacter sp. sgz301302 TaxID=3342379 RepID=UPI0035BAE14D
MILDEKRMLLSPATLGEALAARRQGAQVLAGATWLMRDPRRSVPLPASLVSLHRIADLSAVEIGADHVTIGAGVTHEALARALGGVPEFAAVTDAARGAANPAIRRVATVGGNLCTPDFAAADLVPAFLACGASVEVETAQGTLVLPMPDFLARRRALLVDALVTRIRCPRDIMASAHRRLPLRRAGDYPVAIVSVARDGDGRLRIAVGSVEPEARRWTALEAAIAAEAGPGWQEPQRVAALAAEHNDFEGRDGIEADGWYRRQVLPALLGRALAGLSAKGDPAA